ncbi:MAG: DUF1859 domain-containing protein [Streptosporangiaceae bacterium]
MPKGPTQPTQLGYSPLGIYNGPIPAEGPKCVPVSVSFATANAAVIDFTLLVAIRKVISEFQALWIDNSQNNQQVSILNQQSGQNIIVPAGFQGTVPIFAPNPPVFNVSSTGNGAVDFIFLNVPVISMNWNAVGANFKFDGNGYLEVDDVTLNTLMASVASGAGQLNVLPAPATFLHNSAGSAGVAVKAAAGILYGLSVNTKGTSSSVQLYDSATNATDEIGSFDTTVSGAQYLFSESGLSFLNGLWLVASTATPADITLLYR